MDGWIDDNTTRGEETWSFLITKREIWCGWRCAWFWVVSCRRERLGRVDSAAAAAVPPVELISSAGVS